MSWLEFIGGVASVVALIEIGYLAGKWRAGRVRRANEDELIAGRLQSVLGAVRISHLDCAPHSVTGGQTISITYHVQSEVRFPYEVWLGASAIDSNNQEYWDASQDKSVVLEQGQQTYKRDLTIPSGVSLGKQLLIGTVWVGKRCHTEQSIQIDRAESRDILSIV